jgi:hypothetical protein
MNAAWVLMGVKRNRWLSTRISRALSKGYVKQRRAFYTCTPGVSYQKCPVKPYGLMPGLIFSNWWEAHSALQQSLWLVAVAGTLLLLILIVMSLIDPETEAETTARLSRVFNPRTILTFLSFFGWTGLLISYTDITEYYVVGGGAIAGLVAAAMAKGVTLMLLRLAPRPTVSNPQGLVQSTGRVLYTVPSHRNGFGKVHLNVKGTPYEIEAMTAGMELRRGSSIRVVEVIEEGRVLVVEPLEDKGYPHEEHGLGR